ncbi:hypothetical protein HHI36_016989 [Cryptolaemus montrouzieri]|uniref:Uncharacterized protein n=1 Tax=Cryptolaemus montrouzieri TaxID=559131 RepID=A0ABD2NLR8_9CUCU
MQHQIEAAYTIWMVRNDEESKELYKRLKMSQMNIGKCLTDVDSEYIKNAENETKALWSVINRKTKDRSDDNTSSVPDCEMFNNFFVDAAQKTRQKVIAPNNQTGVDPTEKSEHSKTIKYEKSSMYLLETCRKR